MLNRLFSTAIPLASFVLMVLVGTSATVAPSPAQAQSAAGGMCFEILANGDGFRNTCPDRVSYAYCIINPVNPRRKEGKYSYGQPNCERDEYNGRMLFAGDTSREGPRSAFFGEGVVWLECRRSGGVFTFISSKTTRLVLKPRPHFESSCLGGNGFAASLPSPSLAAPSMPRAVLPPVSPPAVRVVQPKKSPVSAASEFAFNFLKEVGCTQLPFQACEVLDPDNAVNVLKTYETLLVNKYCGTGNVNAAKQLVEIEMALDNDRCRAVLKGISAI